MPAPYPVEKVVKYAVHVPYDNPVPHNVYVDKPYPVVKEVKVPHEVKVPAPYPVEKIEHYPVHIVSISLEISLK